MRTIVISALFLTLALAAIPTAEAHKTAYTPDGKVKIVWGFLNEPAVTFTKTGLDLILTDNATGAPIVGADKTLEEVALAWGDVEERFEDFRGQHGKPGSYTDVVTLTKPGIYTLHLKGKINGSEVHMDIPSAHEIESLEHTYFPAFKAPDAMGNVTALEAKVKMLEDKIAALEAKAKTQATTPATVTEDAATPGPGVALLLVSLAVVAAVAWRRRA